MTRQEITQFGPLFLALYESLVTILFFGCINRFVKTQTHFAWVSSIQWWMTLIVPMFLVTLYAVAIGVSREQFFKGATSIDQDCHLLMFVIFGIVMPPNAVFGFVASRFPDLWERYAMFARRSKESRRD